MRQFVRFDFDDNETLQQAVIQHQISKKFIAIEMQSFLPGDKGKTIAQFQQKFLQMADDGTFQIFFVIRRFTLQAKKFQHHRVFDDFFRAYRLTFIAGDSQHAFFVVAEQQPLI